MNTISVPFEPLKQLSHSSVGNLLSCPRKYQLRRLMPEFVLDVPSQEAVEPLHPTANVHQVFGKVVGIGVQLAMSGASERDIHMAMDMAWNLDLYDENKKASKSFWTALALVDKFIAAEKPKLDKEWEVFHYQGKPACELSFRILLPFGYVYRGFIDLVLQHRVSKKLLVMELKTTGNSTVHESEWANSNQALSYLVVLHALFPEAVELIVDYRIGQVKLMEWTQFVFVKPLSSRVRFLRDLMIQVNFMEMLQEIEDWPMYGSCWSFGRECDYYGICDRPTKQLIVPGTIPTKDFIDEVDLVLDLRALGASLA